MAEACRRAADPRSLGRDLSRPGRLFPEVQVPGGCLRRPAVREGALDLVRLAGFYPVAVVGVLLDREGRLARREEGEAWARERGIPVARVEELVLFRRRREKLVRAVARVPLPTRWGEFTLQAYEDAVTGDVHVALLKGEVEGEEPCLVRVHSECLTGDVLGSLRCDCGEQRDRAMELIAREGRGVFLYMRQEGRGIGLKAKLQAYELQDHGLDTVEANLALGYPADARDYGTGAQILADLGVRRLRLLTNNPRKYFGLAAYGLEIVERVPLLATPSPANRRYLETKRTKLGHLLGPGDLHPTGEVQMRGKGRIRTLLGGS
jgi:3,4-dihydroxy 2-butanone 4-phosphate synthase/GTP cyclohydrolase II